MHYSSRQWAGRRTENRSLGYDLRANVHVNNKIKSESILDNSKGYAVRNNQSILKDQQEFVRKIMHPETQ